MIYDHKGPTPEGKRKHTENARICLCSGNATQVKSSDRWFQSATSSDGHVIVT